MDTAADELDRMDTGDEVENEADVGALRVQIEQTHAEMGETIDALKEKLSPKHLADQARDTLRDATVGRVQAAASAVSDAAVDRAGATAGAITDSARSAGAALLRFLRANRLIAAITGAGIACLWLSAWLHARESS